jgi:hypothetical protein
MSRYHFIGVDGAGKQQSGVVDATSENDAQTTLQARGVFVTKLELVNSAHAHFIPQRPSQPSITAPDKPIPVRVVDVDIEFGTMVWLMVKWVVALFPAALILAVIIGVLSSLFNALFR